MKKIFIILLISLFAAGNAGITTVVHYCGGIPVMSEFATGDDMLYCGMTDSAIDNNDLSHSMSGLSEDSCCRNNFLTFRLTDEYSKSEVTALLQKATAAIYHDYPLEILSTLNKSLHDTVFESPPYKDGSLRILLSSLLI